jgi:hypothetical protein
MADNAAGKVTGADTNHLRGFLGKQIPSPPPQGRRHCPYNVLFFLAFSCSTLPGLSITQSLQTSPEQLERYIIMVDHGKRSPTVIPGVAECEQPSSTELAGWQGAEPGDQHLAP